MLNELLAHDDSWSWFAWDLGFKATLVLLAASALTLALRGASAALRHRVWALTFAALLLLPAAMWLLPGLDWRIVPRHTALAVTATSDVAAAPADAPTTAAPAAPGSPSPTASTQVANSLAAAPILPDEGTPAQVMPPIVAVPQRETATPPKLATAPPSLTAAEWWSWIYLAGAALVLLPLVTGLAGNLRLKLMGRRPTTPELESLADELSRRLGLTRRVTLLVGRPQQMPMTFGWLRPCVVLPPEALDWPAERREMVLVHELAHVKRFDVPWQIVARLACALYWFHPLAWWGMRQMRLEREHACDDCVLSAGQLPSSYAAGLLEIARVHHRTSPLATAALSMARRSQLEGRLLAVLDATRSRRPLGRGRSAWLLVATLLVIVGLGVVRPALKLERAALAGTDEASTDRPPASQGQRVLRGVVLSPEGQPVAGAKIETIGMDDNSGWPYYRALPKQIDHQQGATDAAGRFEIPLGEPVLGKFGALWVFASADGSGKYQDLLTPQTLPRELEIKLPKRRTQRLQLVDTIGNPVAGIKPEVWSGRVWLPDVDAREIMQEWLACPATDAEGFTTVEIAPDSTRVDVLINDENFGSQIVPVEPAEEPVSAVLQPGQFVTGTVTAADTGKPLAGAQVTLLDRPYPQAITSADGTYRLATSIPAVQSFETRELRLSVYPPQKSPYLFKHVRNDRPHDVAEVEIPVRLTRSLTVEGTVREKGTGRPIHGATVWMVQQDKGNAYHRNDSNPFFVGTDMMYATDEQGHFQMPVWYGPGYLLVRGPTEDFVHVMVSGGEKYDGKLGLSREYHHGALKIHLRPDDKPEPVVIELERGLTLRRKVVRPDGQPAVCKAYCRSYMLGKRDISSWQPPIPFTDDGVLELPGFKPAESNPIFIVDLEGHCGLAASPTAAEATSSEPLKLEPCGSARFRFLKENNEPLVDYRPIVELIITPGAPATHHIESGQPLWNDEIWWQNVTRARLKTDAEGRITVPDLIPGATYRLGFVAKEGGWTNGYEFTVRSGETTDVGDVVIPEHK